MQSQFLKVFNGKRRKDDYKGIRMIGCRTEIKYEFVVERIDIGVDIE